MSSRALAVVLLLLASGCTREHDVDLAIGLGGLREVTRGLELRVYPGARCPSADELLAGAVAAHHAQSWRIGAQPVSIGRLDEGPWSFAAIARDAACAPIGVGCITLDVGNDAGGTIPVDPIAAATACGAGRSCSDGLCGDGPAPACSSDCSTLGGTCCGDTCVDVSRDPAHCGGCGRPCPSGQRCSGGSCIDPLMCSPDGTDCTCGAEGCAAGTCCGDVGCVDTTSDASSCGACGHGCPTDLGCNGSFCRPIEPPREIVMDSEGAATPCDLVVGLLWFPLGEPSDRRPPTVGHSEPYDAATGGLPIDGTAAFPPDVLACDGGTPGCIEGAAFAQVVVVGDQNGDGILQLEPEYTSPAAYGVAEGVLIWSDRDRPPSDDTLSALRSSGFEFPEGILEGLYAYRNELAAEGADRWIPDGRSPPVYRLRICAGMTCDTLADAECIAAQPNPFDRSP